MKMKANRSETNRKQNWLSHNGPGSYQIWQVVPTPSSYPNHLKKNNQKPQGLSVKLTKATSKPWYKIHFVSH